jgi:transposase InsO family protein
MASGFMYLAAVIDWFSRYVITWRLSNTLDGGFCPEMLEDALRAGSRVGGRRAHGRVRWLVHRFRSGPQSGSHGHVSSPRLVKRSMRISRTPLS